MITDLDPPTNPGAQAYKVWSLTDIDIDLSSPGFVQRPACGYVLSETIQWTFNPAIAPPMTTYPAEPYKLKIKSTTNADANTYVARLTNVASYQSQNF